MNERQIDRWSYRVLSEAAWDSTPVVDALNELAVIAREHGPITADTLTRIAGRVSTATSEDFEHLDP